MNGLRITLLLIGLVLIAAIYLWGTRSSGLRQRTRQKRRQYDDIRLDVAAADDYTDQAEHDGATLSDPQGWADVATRLRAQEDEALNERREQQRHTAPMTTIAPRVNELEPAKSDKSGKNSERIIVLYVTAPTGYSYDGVAVVEALKTVGMQHGELGIFHHFGVGEMKSSRSLFGVANIVEPGTFDLKTIGEQSTPGLVLFMRLSVVIDAGVVFELMLHTAHRLCELLGGDIRDDKRELLETGRVDELRAVARDG